MRTSSGLGCLLIAAVAFQGRASAEDDHVYVDAAISSPEDGRWVYPGEAFDIHGWSTYDHAEVVVFNFGREAWESFRSVNTRNEPFMNPYGEWAFPWTLPDVEIYHARNPDYFEPGPMGLNGQRSNALYYSVRDWGWNEDTDISFWVGVNTPCGQDEQACCFKSGKSCDGDLRCQASVCRASAPPPPTSCGQLGQPCCETECYGENSVCWQDDSSEPYTCRAWNEAHRFSCMCSNGWQFQSEQQHGCFELGIGGLYAQADRHCDLVGDQLTHERGIDWVCLVNGFEETPYGTCAPPPG